VAPLRLRMSAACPRSAISPSSRCSTDAYLSPKFRVKSTARWITFEESCEKNWSPPPSTLGSDGTVGLVAQAADIHPDTPQEERSERIVLADKHAQNMERLDSLLSALPGKSQCTLQSLLRFYS